MSRKGVRRVARDVGGELDKFLQVYLMIQQMRRRNRESDQRQEYRDQMLQMQKDRLAQSDKQFAAKSHRDRMDKSFNLREELRRRREDRTWDKEDNVFDARMKMLGGGNRKSAVQNAADSNLPIPGGLNTSAPPEQILEQLQELRKGVEGRQTSTSGQSLEELRERYRQLQNAKGSDRFTAIEEMKTVASEIRDVERRIADRTENIDRWTTQTQSSMGQGGADSSQYDEVFNDYLGDGSTDPDISGGSDLSALQNPEGELLGTNDVEITGEPVVDGLLGQSILDPGGGATPQAATHDNSLVPGVTPERDPQAEQMRQELMPTAGQAAGHLGTQMPQGDGATPLDQGMMGAFHHDSMDIMNPASPPELRDQAFIRLYQNGMIPELPMRLRLQMQGLSRMGGAPFMQQGGQPGGM